MAKQRFTPPILKQDTPTKPSALVFPERSAQTQTQPERYQRYFPGIEPAANQPRTTPQPQEPPCAAFETPDTVPEAAPAQDTAQTELMAAFEKAAHEGFAAGVAQAQEQTQARIDEHMAQMESMLRCIVDLRKRTFEAYQEQCLELALTGAEALAKKHFSEHRDAMRALLLDAIQALTGQDTVLLHVGPDNAPELQDWVNQRFVDQKVQVLVDDQMAPEDFRATTKSASVTGDFQERLQKLRQLILQHRGTLDEEHQVQA